MDVFLAAAADTIASQMQQAMLSDDEVQLRRLSQSLDAGARAIVSWVNASLGSIISLGTDEIRARVPADHLDELESIRFKYESATGSPLSVGVGMKLSDADRALLAARLKGGNRVVLFTPEVGEEIRRLQQSQQSQQPGFDQWLGKNERAAWRHRGTGAVVPVSIHDPDQLPGPMVDYEDGFVDDQGEFLTREQALEQIRRLKKADAPPAPEPETTAPENKPNAGGGFTGRQEPGSAQQPQAPIQEQSQSYSQGMATQAMADTQQSPEMTQAAGDFEDELHDHAQEQDQQDQQQDQQAGVDDIKKQVVDILQQVRQQAPAMEQLRDQAPDLYAAMQGVVAALLLTAHALIDGQSDSEKVVDEKGQQAQAEGSASAPAQDTSPAQEQDTKKSEREPCRSAHFFGDRNWHRCIRCGLKNPKAELNKADFKDDPAYQRALAVRKRIEDLMVNDHASVWKHRHNPKGVVVVSMDPSKPGAWRVTHFDGETPTGHQEAPTHKDALWSAHASGADLFSEPLKILPQKPLNKVRLPEVKPAPTHPHVTLPVGSSRDGKVKVQHEDGHQGWVSVRAGQVLSNDGHPVSSRNPGGR